MIPSYITNEWQVVERRTPVRASPGMTNAKHAIQIRIKENGEWKDYWVPQDPANSDFVQYQEWLAEGNEPRIIF